MTEQESIKTLKQSCYCDYDLSATIENCEVSSCDRKDATKMAIKALQVVEKIAEIIKIEQQSTSCEYTKLKSFAMIEKIITDYQLENYK
jgi:hypothetical protein